MYICIHSMRSFPFGKHDSMPSSIEYVAIASSSETTHRQRFEERDLSAALR